MDMLWELKQEQDAECARLGDKWQDTDRLFIKWDGRPMHNNTPYYWFTEFCENNNLRFCDIHSLRHSHVSLLINMGYSAVAIVNRVGHESVDITYRYAHMFPNEQQNMVEKLDDLKEGDTDER